MRAPSEDERLFSLMIPRGPVLYVKHAALDNVNPNDIDGLREVWSSFSGAKQHISQGTRLEYLSWRLYSRSIMQRQRQSSHLPVPELDVPPALEMSSSTDSLTPATGRLSSQKLMTLFDRIVTFPATPEDLDKQEPETGPLPSASIDVPVVKVTPVSTPELEIPPPTAAGGPGPVAIPAKAERSPAVCGFDKVSVSSRSTANVASILASSPLKSSLKVAAASSAAAGEAFSSRAVPTTTTPNGSKSMFFIESSSDSEAESDHGLSPSPLLDAIPVPVPTRPGLVRRKTVTFEEPTSASIAPPTEDDDDNDDDDGFEDCSDDDDDDDNDDDVELDEEDEDDAHDWGDSDWDDLSEDDEPLFSGRDVPLQPQEHRSLLSSMFIGCAPQQDVEDAVDDAEAAALEDEELDGIVPSPVSLPRSIPRAGSSSLASSASGSVHLGRVESQSSMFDHAMRTGGQAQHEQILLGGPIRTHRPFRNTKSSEDLMERELSQSVRSNISNKRQYDLDALWAKSNASAKPPPTRARRPTLSRSSTLPSHRSFQDDDDTTDTSYHARGW